MAEKRNMNGKKPIAIGFDFGCRNTQNLPNPGGFRIEYKCPRCGTETCRYLGSHEKHCHHCGQKIDWRVITYLNSSQSDKIENAACYIKDELIAMYLETINAMNEEKKFAAEVYISEFDTVEEEATANA